jgi:16S rRNA (guanine(966)-N(2))-methyltransferase RsmD
MRVIAGALGGRKLVAPRGSGTRPTSDRVREALFSALGSVEGDRVLDLYAGSGALAIEALSRGAERATCVERASTALRALQRNVEELELGASCQVVGLPLCRALAAVARHGPYDLVLVDPPYELVRSGRLAAELAPWLSAPGLLAAGARLILEHATRDQPPDLERAQLERSRRYGDTTLSCYLLAPLNEPPAEPQ